MEEWLKGATQVRNQGAIFNAPHLLMRVGFGRMHGNPDSQ